MKRLTIAMCALAIASPGCKAKRKAKSESKDQAALQDINGLAAMPSSVRVVVGARVASLSRATLVLRAVLEWYRREPELKQRISAFFTTCSVSVKRDIDEVIVGFASPSDPVMAIGGSLTEQRLVPCLTEYVQGIGGTLTTRPLGARRMYRVGLPERELWFAQVGARTIVVTRTPALLEAAMSGKSVLDDPTMSSLVQQAVRQRPGHAPPNMWAAGIVLPGLGAKLVELGYIEKPVSALVVSAGVTDGVWGELTATMASAEDARRLKEALQPQLDALALIAQRWSVGDLVSKMNVVTNDNSMVWTVSASAEEVKRILSTIDRSGQGEQDSRP